jgi:phosphatidyl-myo-inositol dimannoside synthase
MSRYRLNGHAVIMTLARLAGAERYKGIDEVLECLPELLRVIPSLRYLIVGEGQDQARLEAKAVRLGVREQVVFTGYVAEDDKPDYYRLSDLFVMPGRGEGFGIVYLEALACGIPVIASTRDASREAVRQGELGVLVDPGRREELTAAILSALSTGSRSVPSGLAYFSPARFRERWHRVVSQLAMPDSTQAERASTYSA